MKPMDYEVFLSWKAFSAAPALSKDTHVKKALIAKLKNHKGSKDAIGFKNQFTTLLSEYKASKEYKDTCVVPTGVTKPSNNAITTSFTSVKKKSQEYSGKKTTSKKSQVQKSTCE